MSEAVVYLDNAATSHPKPAEVYRAAEHALVHVGASPGRGAHRLAREASGIVDEARKLVSRFFQADDPQRIIFTRSATESLNVVLHGYLKPGDRLIVSHMEHNSVARPSHTLEKRGVEVVRLPCSRRGLLDLTVLEKALETPAALVVVNHASNVNGALQPIPRVAEMCGSKGVPLMLDAAQTAGIQPISIRDWDLGMLACSGHKGLLGPPGVGVLYIREDLQVEPLMEGGTGSRSEELDQPDFCPDRFESGTPNLPGIAGVAAGIRFLLEKGLEQLTRHELHLAELLEAGLDPMKDIQVLSPEIRGTGVVSFVVEGLNPSDVGDLLDRVYGIAVRTGLHCAPLAHQALGTYPQGTVRVSPGIFNTENDMEFFLKSMKSILSMR